ncbi:hypothetical protein Anas_04864 [Armadillidium nasatum]|uniref:Uncharacterized protein n=1 Tax=Armadillidium nasatum TaxID=96803 RepID=A0A5N5SLR8_9CRUS|nr:hypothetical protein Anas_04864 [Armadillidium nasatum]
MTYVRSITFQEEVVGVKSRSINEDVIVPMEYLPYPESEPFYTDIVPEIQRAANRSKRAITVAYPFGPPQSSLVMDFYFNIEVANPGHHRCKWEGGVFFGRFVRDRNIT